jgi:hypothetical protein
MVIDSTAQGALFREGRARANGFLEHAAGLRRIVNKGDQPLEDSGGKVGVFLAGKRRIVRNSGRS